MTLGYLWNQRNGHIVSTLRTSAGARCDNFFFLCCSTSVIRWYKIKFWDCQATYFVGLWASLNCPFLLLLFLDLDVSLSFRQRCKLQVDHYLEKCINNSVIRNSLLNVLCLFFSGCHRVLLDALAPSTSSSSSGRTPRSKTARRLSSSIGEESDQKYLFNITYNSRQMGIS
jgi:hypothetical protein